MGMSGIFGSSSCCLTPPSSLERYPNPNPARFEILRTRKAGSSLVVEVVYPDCTNYEGRKVMVFTNTTEKELLLVTHLDPHFSCWGGGPVARFEPTSRGWALAVACAKILG